MLRRRFTYPALSLALLASGYPAGAQNGVPLTAANPLPLNATAPGKAGPVAPVAGADAGGAPVVAGPTAPAISILLLAIDEVPSPDAPVTPVNPANPDGGTAAAITPAQLGAWAPRPVWQALAQTKVKKKKPSEDDLFKLEPDGRALLPGELPAPSAATPVQSLTPLPPVGGQFEPAPAGRAQLTALPMRRALLSLGWADVMPIAIDSTTVSRAIGERRLTPRTLDALKSALSQLSKPGGAPSAETTQNATVAAARVGQALGYRAVVAFYVSPTAPKDGAQSAGFSFIVADSSRESGEPILFDEQGANEAALREVGASTAAALLDKTLRGWPSVNSQERIALSQKHLLAGRNAIQAGDTLTAQEEITQSIALDSSRSESYALLGDLLSPNDPVGSAVAYRRAVELNARDGATWAKVATAYVSGPNPVWPLALEAGNKALQTSFDSVQLRVAMATAQFGRADLFRKAERLDRAEDAELEARKHLERALELAPDDPAAVRLLARTLIEARRFSEATVTLDRVAPRYPKDVEIQTLYASALLGQSGRESDAFAAYARVWQLSGQRRVDVDATMYRALAKGFDVRVYEIGRSALGLTTGVANGAVPREDALLQLTKLKEDMNAADNAINVLRAPMSISPEAPASRVFAADLMTQSLEAQQIFLETGQDLQRSRGAQLNAQAITRLNAARTAR